MKHLLMISLLAGFGPAAFGQSWAPFYPGDTCIYRNDTSEFFAHTVWVDSVGLQANEESWQLNPSNHLCDTCDANRYCGNLPLLIDQPFPFGSAIRVQDSSRYIFDQSQHGNILLLTGASAGTSWLMDSIRMISATVAQVVEDSVWGQIDSMKIIHLSTGDSILLSKQHGMLSFPDSISRGIQLQLAGVLNKDLGEKVIDFWDIYDYQVGDVLFYSYGGGSVWGGSGGTDAKVLIVSKSRSADTISFQVLMKGKTEYYDYSNSTYVGFDSLVKTWSFVYQPGLISGSLPNQLVYSEFRDHVDFQYNQTLWQPPFIDSSLIAPARVSPEVKEVQVMYDLSILSSDCFAETVTSKAFILRTEFVNDFQFRFEKGLGQTLYSYSGFESGGGIQLVGYIRNGDTVGTVFTDEYLFVSNDYELPPSNIRIYPNPAHDLLTISVSEPKLLPAQARVQDLHGRLVRSERLSEPEARIRLSDLPVGLYHVEVVSGRGEGVFWEKVVVE